MDFVKNLLKNNDVFANAILVSENLDDEVHYVDTGAYALNALLSGSIYGGVLDNKVTALAGDPSTGKTYICLSVAANFLKKHPQACVFYFESEGSLDKTVETKKMLQRRGIDTARFFLSSVLTIQEFKTQSLQIVTEYLNTPEDKRIPVLFVLDSLGGLSTNKEMEDGIAGSDTQDMTLARKIKSTFRTLTLKLNQARIPLILTSHTYDQIGAMFPQKIMTGGKGVQYAASTVVLLSKAKAKDSSGDVTGANITFRLQKSRVTRENRDVTLHLNHTKGLDRYVGILDIAEVGGVIKKNGNKWELPNGEKAFESAIYKNPEKYFTKDFLDLIDNAAKDHFLYGEDEEDVESDTETEGDVEPVLAKPAL